MKKIVLAVLVCALLLMAGPQTAKANPPASNPTIHIVQWGENLIGIARRYGTTVYAIVQANQLANSNRIYAGQRLIIPGSWTPPPPPSGGTYIVQRGDTLSSIARRYVVSVSDLVRLNGIVNPNRIYPGQRLLIPGSSGTPPPPPPGTGTVYVVQRGDTLARIAVRFGTSVWAIVQNNNIANPNVIYPGQRLYIVAGSGGWVKPGCEHLAWPRADAWLSGIVSVRGTADLANFGYYKLEYRKDGVDDWHYIGGADKPVQNGALGTWDTRTVANGRYLFRLVIVNQTGNYPPPCEIAVQVKN